MKISWIYSLRFKSFIMKVLIGVLCCFALQTHNAQAAGTKDTLNIGMMSEFENLNPMIYSQAATGYMLRLAYRPLVALSLENKWVPVLIKKMPTLENKLVKKKGEGIEIQIEFIDNLKWGDGVAVTCKDIEFAWQVGMHPNVSTSSKEEFENIKSIKWANETPTKCVIEMAKAKYNYFNSMPDPMPEHLEAAVFNKFKDKPEGYDHNSLYTKDPSNPGLYNGPFMVSEVKLGSHVMFVNNPNFYGKKPAIKKMVFKLIPNAATLTAHLQAGDIDMVSPAGGLGLDQAIAFEKKISVDKSPFRVAYADGFVYAHIDLNLENPALADLRVRKAISMAFNKKDILSMLDGKAKEAKFFVANNDMWASDKAPVYSFNKREANKLLDEAGWKLNAKGIREKNGKTLSLTLMAVAGIKLTDMIEVYVQSQLKSVGIEISIKNEPARVFFGETTKHRKFDMAFYSWVSIPESSPRSMLHSTMIPSEKNSWSGQNQPGWKNAKVDKLVDALEVELNQSKRALIGKQITEIYAQEIPVIPIYFRPNNSVVPAGMKNYKLSGHLYYETLYAESWEL